MKCLVDTNVISELGKADRCNSGVSAWYAAADERDLCTSVLVLSEIREGLERLRPRDPIQAGRLEGWLADVASAFGARALPVDAAVADTWGQLNGTRPLPVIDGLLAATAKVHGLTLVTRSAADVMGLEVSVLDPFD